MDKYNVDISDLAKQDIRDITSYIMNVLQEPAVAFMTTDAILDGISTLDEMPARVPLVNNERLAKKQIRGLQIKNYTAFFRINETAKTVDIIRVIYSRRDWQVLF